MALGGELLRNDPVGLPTATEQGLGIARLPGLLLQEGLLAERLVAWMLDQAPPPSLSICCTREDEDRLSDRADDREITANGHHREASVRPG